MRALFNAVVIATAFLLHACSGDFSVALPGGYELTRVHAGAVVLNHPDKGVVIDANIDGYKIVGDIVAGHVVIAERAPDNAYSKPGYFLVNTKTHEVIQGMDKARWLASLRKMGVTEEPQLRKPSRFD
jgi:hypothetical protein